MVFEIVFTERAQRDFDSIITYLSEHWTDEIILRFIFHLENAISRIRKYPDGFPFYDEVRSIRKCSLRPHYGIFYLVEEHRVSILTIFDFRQDPKKLRKRV